MRGKGHDETIRRRRNIEDKEILFERRKVNDKEFTKDKLKSIPDIVANWPLVERLAIWLAAGKPNDSAALASDVIAKAANASFNILADLADQFKDLPETVKIRWHDRSAMETSARSLLLDWANLSAEGETQKKVTALRDADIDLIHPKDDWKRPILESWMAKNKSGAERRKHSPHDDKGEVIENVLLLVPAGLPRSVKGDVIRRVRLTTTTQTARQIAPRHMSGKLHQKHGHPKNRQGGFVENASIVRTDVFYVPEKRTDSKGRKITPGYYLVPVYNWQILDKRLSTPLKAILANKPEVEWPEMHAEDFLFSLYKDTYVEIKERAGITKEGFFRSTDRALARITFAHPLHRPITSDYRCGVKTVKSLEKFTIDRLGGKHRVWREKWPGHCFPTKPLQHHEH